MNRLFGMFHAKTPQQIKDNIVRTLQDPNTVDRVVFASVTIGMGVDLQGVNIVLHYGAPSSIEDYFQVRIYTDPVIFGFKIGQFFSLLFNEKFHVIAKITLSVCWYWYAFSCLFF